jgi:hypothetical protein
MTSFQQFNLEAVRRKRRNILPLSLFEGKRRAKALAIIGNLWNTKGRQRYIIEIGGILC